MQIDKDGITVTDAAGNKYAVRSFGKGLVITMEGFAAQGNHGKPLKYQTTHKLITHQSNDTNVTVQPIDKKDLL